MNNILPILALNLLSLMMMSCGFQSKKPMNTQEGLISSYNFSYTEKGDAIEVTQTSEDLPHNQSCGESQSGPDTEASMDFLAQSKEQFRQLLEGQARQREQTPSGCKFEELNFQGQKNRLTLKQDLIACGHTNRPPGVQPERPTTPTTPEREPVGSDSTASAECQSKVGDGVDAIREQVCSIVSMERSQNGRPAITLDSDLSKVAQAHAEDMSAKNYFSHTSLDGRNVTQRISQAGIRYSTAAENIALGQRSEEEVMDVWMKSSGHRTNILNTSYGRIGIGYTNRYWVQVFTN